MNDPKKIRGELIDMLEELDEHLEKITKNITDSDRLSRQSLETLVAKNEDEQTRVKKNFSVRNMIFKIKQAITKIDQGGYGVCIDCGATISPERLQGTPYIDKCSACAEGHDSE